MEDIKDGGDNFQVMTENIFVICSYNLLHDIIIFVL